MTAIVPVPEVSLPYLRQTFSEEQLSTLYHATNTHIKYLSLLKESYVREDWLAVRRIFLLDFQEIYTYAYPLSGPVSYHPRLHFAAIRYLFNNAENCNFFVPDGTVIELYKHLEGLSASLQRAQVFHDLLSMGLSEEDPVNVEAWLNAVTSVEKTNVSSGVNTTMIARELTGMMSNYSYAAKRMSDLLSQDNIFNAQELGIVFDKRHHELIEQYYTTTLNALDDKRNKHENNIADALNVMWTAVVRNQGVEGQVSPYHGYLITHTPSLFDVVPDFTDPFASKYGFTSPLLWDPMTAVYSVILENKGLGVGVRKWINLALAASQNLQAALDQILEEMINDGDETITSEEDLLFSLSPLQAEQFRDGFAPFKAIIYDPFSEPFSDFEKIWREAARFDSDKLLGSKNVDISARRNEAAAFGHLLEQTKSRISLVDAQLALLTDQKNEFIEQIEDGKLGKKRFSLKNLEGNGVSHQTFDKYTRVALERKSGRRSGQLITIDQYANLASVYWITTSSAQAWIDLLNLQLKSLEARGITIFDEESDDPQILSGKIIAHFTQQTHNGISSFRRVATITNLPIFLNGLIDSQKDAALTFFRINTKVGDFCYYSAVNMIVTNSSKEASSLKDGSYVGVITSYNNAELISPLHRQMNPDRVGLDDISKFLEEHLKYLGETKH